jgi:N-acetylneuraminic acid mutarotase
MVMIAGGINGAGAVEKSVELYDPVNNKWVRTGDMKTARRGHAATLLRDGRVLVTGGYDGTTATSALNKAETYDPATGVWTNTTGTLVQARRWHTSTLLNNDKVLIVGGGVSSGVSRVVELFDPVAGTFTSTGSLQLPRQGHTATLLPNGTQVLVAGRNNADNTFNAGVDSSRTTELYDISAGTWSAGPVMTYGRDSHTATIIGNSNTLLVTGGYGAGTNKVETLDLTVLPLAWTPLTSTMSVSRALHTSTYIPSLDKVLVIGGYNAVSQMLMSTELFTLNASTPWSTTGNKELTLGRAMHTSTLLSNGNVLVVGTYYTSSGTVSNTAEIWSP